MVSLIKLIIFYFFPEGYEATDYNTVLSMYINL